MTYSNWKGFEGIYRAEEIEARLRRRLGKTPGKKDFYDEGESAAWWALYRFRRRQLVKSENSKSKNNSACTKCHRNLVDLREILAATERIELVETIFLDCALKLSPSNASSLLEKKFTKKYGYWE
ncbi:MAG: hypothetical protein C0402_07015 [Thermodesulfovibrio sp.]|nr:hypothetical protein [Thermodesulfovibrio sp.]